MKPNSRRHPESGPAAASFVGTKVQSKFKEALALNQKGQLDEARELYRQVLMLQLRHFDTLFLSGVMAAMTHAR